MGWKLRNTVTGYPGIQPGLTVYISGLKFGDVMLGNFPAVMQLILEQVKFYAPKIVLEVHALKSAFQIQRLLSFKLLSAPH